ncbi:AEC family transporter [Algibacillus agarilyticus]|uniref:AEC family transporter n=1 Tax=Algibacillus agarilyticus TaxID=2234133 RepID=UPI000DD0A6E7|nr:AEC family transporter [Algibacillus agarilyticus]
MSLLDHLLSALNITGPVLFILLAGILFKHLKLIDSQFVATGSKLVFTITLPCLLFLSVAANNPSESLNLPLVSYAVAATVASVVLVWFISPLLIAKAKRAVFTQCAFRGNMGIIGLALSVNAFGSDILAMAAVYLAVLTIFYNVLSVLLLSDSPGGVFKNLMKNPLIISIVLGGSWAQMGLTMPSVANDSLKYLAQLTLPLALLCIGASLEWQSLKANHKEALYGTLLKLVVLPAIITIIAINLGFTGAPLGVLFLMMATPTAAAAFVMSKQMTPYGNLAAEIITLSTALSPISITLGLVVLSYYHYI